MANISKTLLFFLAGLLFSACNQSQNKPAGDPPYVEPVAEKIVYTNANLVYVGDDIDAGSSDSWSLSLYTDMELDQANNPIGPGKILRLSLSTQYNDKQVPDLSLLQNTYLEQTNNGDFAPGTFCAGYMLSIDLPGGKIEIPEGSFFGDLASGATEFEPDLLREGFCKIEVATDGSMTISGVLVGEKFIKRNFSYQGTPKIVNRAEPDIPNSSLTNDITLSGLTVARLADRGDAFMLKDDSYRLFELCLAQSSVDFSTGWPKGNGDLIRVEMFVPWSADVTQGIPAGDYTVVTREPNSGIDREKIVPFNIVPGYPDRFTYLEGSWYQSLTEGVMTGYARIFGGTMKVERPNGGADHLLTIKFWDTNSPAYKVNCTWQTSVPIPVI